MKKDQSDERYARCNRVYQTYAANRPEDERSHHNWRRGIQG